MVQTRPTVPPLLRLAAHGLRWQLLGELATSDYRVRELVELVGQPQSLVSYHLRLLRDAELVSTRRSSYDARDSYYHLDLDRCADMLASTGVALHPALQPGSPAPPPGLGRGRRLSVLFACTGNSARSPMAEALLHHHTGGAVNVMSAGSHPKEQIHPSVVRVLRDVHGIDIADQQPRHLGTLTRRQFDFVVTLCDRVREVCPEFVGHPRHIHWSIPEPAPEGVRGKVAEAAVRRTAHEIDVRISHLIHMLATQH